MSSLIIMEHASLSFGPQSILRDVSLRIAQGDKIGLVGANGSGKTSLLRVLLGQQTLDNGRVQRSRTCRIGYLPQDVLEIAGDTLLSSVLDSVPGRADLEQQLRTTEDSLEQTADPDVQMDLAHKLVEIHDSLDHFDLYYGEHQAIRILNGLGFPDDQLSRPVTELSGGWKMRAALAGLLFQQPDVLFMDEPTNHLDVPSVMWLDNFLDEYRHATVLICHDREFLNRHIDRVVSFEPEGLRTYAGNYDSYIEQRSAEEEIIEAQTRNRDRQIRDMERFVERFRAKATKARQAQSRAKQIERMQREIEKPVPRRRRLQFKFPPVERSGRDVLLLESVGKSFGDLHLYRDMTRGIYAGDRVAIIGANGVGKTTLLKLMAGELDVDNGSIRYGANVKPGYYAQHHTDLLSPRRTVLEQVWEAQPNATESFTRGVCGAFLFSGDDVDKAVGVLSGGERARVLLARLLVNPGNLLLMDEPTNHLDVAAAEALAEALAGYDGTIVFVSHNTSFVNRLATKLWDIVDGTVIEYPGNLTEYMERKQSAAPDRPRAAMSQPAVAAENEPVVPQGKHPAGEAKPAPQTESGAPLMRKERKERKRREANRRNETKRKDRRLRTEIEKLEQRVSQLEADQQELEPQLADPAVYADKQSFQRILGQYNDNRDKLEQLYARWERGQSELEASDSSGEEPPGPQSD